MPKYCTECGVELTEKDKFCTNCGLNLRDENVTDDDIKIVLNTLNTLLDDLPDKVINSFVKTKEFSVYEKVMRKYKIK